MKKKNLSKFVLTSVLIILIPVSNSFADGNRDSDDTKPSYLVADYDVSNSKSYSLANPNILKDLMRISPNIVLFNQPILSNKSGIRALEFNNSKAQYGSTITDFQGLDRFTVETYMKFSNPLPTGERAAIVTQAFTGQSVVGPSIFFTGTDYAPALRLFGGYYYMGSDTPNGWNSAPLYSGEDNRNSGILLKKNIWYHIALTFDGSILKLYVDGVLKATNVGSGPSNNSAPLFIGRRWDYFPPGTESFEWASQYFFSGSIASVKIYSESISAGAVKRDYKSASAKNEEGKGN